jgi:hydrogenase maturation protease
MSDGRRQVVLGLGNIILRDEGVGIHAMQALKTHVGLAAAALEFVDGGVLGMNLLPLVEECRYLLLLDAINAGLPPGTVMEMDRETIPQLAGVKLSEHQLTFQEVLGLARLRDTLPPYVYLIGIQPQDMGVGLELTPVVAEKLPEVVDRAAARLRQWGLI